MQTTIVNLPVPNDAHTKLRGGITKEEEKELRDKYPDDFTGSAIELWLFDQLIAIYAEELYDIPADSAEYKPDGSIGRKRNNSGQFGE